MRPRPAELELRRPAMGGGVEGGAECVKRCLARAATWRYSPVVVTPEQSHGTCHEFHIESTTSEIDSRRYAQVSGGAGCAGGGRTPRARAAGLRLRGSAVDSMVRWPESTPGAPRVCRARSSAPGIPELRARCCAPLRVQAAGGWAGPGAAHGGGRGDYLLNVVNCSPAGEPCNPAGEPRESAG